MKLTRFATVLALLPLAPAPVMAADPAKGADDFRKCRSCHGIIDAAGEAIVKGGKTGPNLFGVIGRPVASDGDFKYSDALIAAGAAGIVWDQENLAAYITDPKAWLEGVLDDPGAVSKMTYKHRQGAEDMAAYLASLGP